MRLNLASKACSKRVQRVHLCQACPQLWTSQQSIQRQWKKPAEGIPDGVNSSSFCGTQERSKHGWKHMRVLVAIKVGEWQSGRLKALELCGGFGLDFRRIQLSHYRGTGEIAQPWTKL